MSKTRYIFVSHSYKDADLYHDLIAQLRKRSHFRFQDRSVPDITLIENGKVKYTIRKRIQNCDVMLVFARPIATKSDMIQFELTMAKQYEKPIIAIKPTKDRNVSTVVRKYADVLIEWDVEEIVRQIRVPGAPPKQQVEAIVEVNDSANAEVPTLAPEAASRQKLKDVLRRALGLLPRSAQPVPVSSISPEQELIRKVDS
jgi:TIR domain